VVGAGDNSLASFAAAGPQTVTATVTDSIGHTASASRNVTVLAATPTPVILLPTSGAQVAANATFALDGFASYGLSSTVPCSDLVWTDSTFPGEAMNQSPTTGCTPLVTLTNLGTHTIVLSVPAGPRFHAVSTTVTFTVSTASEPVAVIVSPLGTATNPVIFLRDEGLGFTPPMDWGFVSNEPNQFCSVPGPGCATLEWSFTACGTTVTQLGSGQLGCPFITGCPGVPTNDSIISSLGLPFDPVGQNLLPPGSCDTGVLSFCVTDPSTPTPVCAETFVQVLEPAK
jgi:hypothetical protein